jgi:beta-glucosidase
LTKESARGKKIALIGFAKDAMAHGGGSASVNAYYKVTPWEGLNTALGDVVEFTYAKGVHKERLLPPIINDGSVGSVIGLDGQPGFTRLLLEEGKPEPVSTLHGYPRSAYSPLGSNESFWKTLEIVGNFIPSETGSHYIACSGLGPTEITINDETVFEQKGNCTDPMGSLFLAAPEEEIRYHFEAGKTYCLRIRSEPPVKIGLEILEGRSGVRVGFSLESIHDADLEGEAVRVAAEADIAIVFTGHDPQWETEGRDQDSFNLPRKGTQDSLVAAVAGVNKQTIVVNSTGVAIAMPWLGQIKGLVQAWFSGQECGNSIADVLTGIVNPEGRLPVTFPRSIEDSPAHGNFPGRYVDGQLKVNYAEGVFVGYRHFDRLDSDKVNFPFGYGLSYSTFDFGKLSLAEQEGNDDGLDLAVRVINTGKVAGGVLVQIYAGRSESSSEHPVKSLVAFQKIRLEPGASEDVHLSIKARDFAYFNEEKQRWVVDAGLYDISLGSSASNILQSVAVALRSVEYGL